MNVLERTISCAVARQTGTQSNSHSRFFFVRFVLRVQCTCTCCDACTNMLKPMCKRCTSPYISLDHRWKRCRLLLVLVPSSSMSINVTRIEGSTCTQDACLLLCVMLLVVNAQLPRTQLTSDHQYHGLCVHSPPYGLCAQAQPSFCHFSRGRSKSRSQKKCQRACSSLRLV